jgi:beta-N-acetylhexosaminidase
VIGDRALGTEPLRVAALGRAMLDGLAAAGVAGVVKHMPGHGRAGADSHKELPTVTAPEADLEIDLAPFRALAHADIAMTGHILFTAWDAENPATQSPFIVEEIIRRRIGFEGLLLTDDIDMEALSGTIAERSARAIAAGCDIVLNCWAKMDEMVSIAGAIPTMSAVAKARLDKALAATQVPADPGHRHAEAIARRDALLGLLGAPV